MLGQEMYFRDGPYVGWKVMTEAIKLGYQICLKLWVWMMSREESTPTLRCLMGKRI